ncbi:type II secretion system protein M [Alteromonas pelagimontana]|uniref:Type II secretion system protein M n=1 Tax=Alteromonas pelagimontana TaxID=1858656 RepID=A0A6M4MC97_9ALTE|nr:type II secretion system protein M [Alteromonas pelagimontana]QJR80821.1 type II secretion system protein M [Alteromonas pelagimontana]
MKALWEKYRALTEREQYLVLISGVFVVIAMFYWLIWAPLTASVERAQIRLESQQNLLSWVQERTTRAQQLQRSATGTTRFTGSLPQAVSSTTNRYNIAVSRMQPQGEEIQVWIDQAPFNDVLSWLQALESMGIVILQADISAANASGHIEVRRLQLGKS